MSLPRVQCAGVRVRAAMCVAASLINSPGGDVVSAVSA